MQGKGGTGRIAALIRLALVVRLAGGSGTHGRCGPDLLLIGDFRLSVSPGNRGNWNSYVRIPSPECILPTGNRPPRGMQPADCREPPQAGRCLLTNVDMAVAEKNRRMQQVPPPGSRIVSRRQTGAVAKLPDFSLVREL